MDDWFLADLTLIWHANPVYTNIHWYHYVAESRYNGGEVATIAPDYSPSAIHADYHLPVRIGTDAALALAMCKVIIDAGLYKKQFVQEQTDLPLLVRKDTGPLPARQRRLPGATARISSSGWDTLSGSLACPRRGTRWRRQARRSRAWRAPLQRRPSRTAAAVEVEPVFARLRRHLEDYTPERAGEICQIHPENIRKLARKVATRKTKIFIGWNSGKYYHGDLMERADGPAAGSHRQLGQEGNRDPLLGHHGNGRLRLFMTRKDGARDRRRLAEADRGNDRHAAPGGITPADPTMTDRDDRRTACGDGRRSSGGMGDVMAPRLPLVLPVRLQGALERSREQRSHHEAELRRVRGTRRSRRAGGVRELLEGLRRGRAAGALRVGRQSMLRRQRGGQKLLLEHLWPKLKMIVSVDYRITTTGLYSDYILPAAQHYEKLGQHAVGPPPQLGAGGHARRSRRVTPCPTPRSAASGAEKIEERAAERGIKPSSPTARGQPTQPRESTMSRLTLNGASARRGGSLLGRGVRDNAVYGILPEGTTSRDPAREGTRALHELGHGGPRTISQASTIQPDEVHNPLRWHTEDKIPYDTLVRRAQYYIDHEWFLEAGEELADVHKEPPGTAVPKRRFQMTSGHNRWSIHSMNLTNNIIQNTHRGEPFVFINDQRRRRPWRIENGEKMQARERRGRDR